MSCRRGWGTAGGGQVRQQTDAAPDGGGFIAELEEGPRGGRAEDR